MLFDLRSRGRRTTVRVVYGGLAVLFVFAFVGFGVGTGLGGNLSVSSLFGSEAKETTYTKQVAQARKRTTREPTSAAAWLARAEAELRQSAEPEYSNVNSTTGGFTPKGKKLLGAARRSWEEYLRLEPKNPSAALAKRMSNVLGEGGAEQPAAEVRALQLVIASEPPSAALYAALAQYSYMAGNKRQGDLAGEKALELAPKAKRAELKGQLAALKKNGGHLNSSAASTAEGSGEG
jgi:hypothetical protein